MNIDQHKIIFYDGDCGFCNRSVQFALDHEKKSELHFCALQSQLTHDFFKQKGFPEPDLSTFYYWNGSKLASKSSAALNLTRELRFPWPLFGVFKLVPRFIRDWVYDGIAKRRHRISNGFCMLPQANQLKRFLKD